MGVLDLPSLLTLASLVVIYGVYAITWLFWYIFKDKSGQSIVEAEQVLFTGGPKLIRNVVFLGIAISQLFTPCMLNEQLIGSTLHTIVMLISRIVAFLLCMYFWNHLAALRFRDMEEYLMKRFDSKLLLILHLFNRIAGLFYIWNVYFHSYDKFRLFNVKSLVSFVHLMCAFGTFSALGGMNVVLVGCTILWIVGFSSDIFLLHEVHPLVFINSSAISYNYDPCYDLLGPNYFLMILGQLLTVQPVYTIFQAANSITEANIAMFIGLVLTIINTIITMCTTNGLLAFTSVRNLDPYNGVHLLYGHIFKRAEWFTPVALPQSQMDKSYESVVLRYRHFYILLGTHVSNTIAFYLLQMQDVTITTYLHILPNWLRIGLVSDGRELHMTYSCLYILCAYLTVVLLIYSTTTLTESKKGTYTLFQPYASGMLILPATCYILLAPLYPDLWSIPTLVSTTAIYFTGIIFALQTSDKLLNESCIAQWYPTVIFISALLGNIILSRILPSSQYIPPGLLFKYHIRCGKKSQNTHALSVVVAPATGARLSQRNSIRMNS